MPLDQSAHQRALEIRNLMDGNAASAQLVITPPDKTAPTVPSTRKVTVPNPPVGPAPSWQNTYYDNSSGKFWRLSPKGLWTCLYSSALRDHLIVDGYDAFPRKGDALSEVDRVIVKIQQEQMVHFTGNLAGHGKGLCIQGDTRILVTGEPKFIDPVAGNCDMLKGVLERMFGPQQLPFVYGWIKIALAMFHARTWMAESVDGGQSRVSPTQFDAHGRSASFHPAHRSNQNKD